MTLINDFIDEINKILSNPNTTVYSRWWALQYRAFLHIEGLGGPIDFKRALKCFEEAQDLSISIIPKDDIETQIQYKDKKFEVTPYGNNDLYSLHVYMEVLLKNYGNSCNLKYIYDSLASSPSENNSLNTIFSSYISSLRKNATFSIFHLNILKLTIIKSYPSWRNLLEKLQYIHQHACKLIAQDIPKGRTLNELYQQLHYLILDFIILLQNNRQTKDDYANFRLLFILALREKLPELQIHHAQWKYITLNLLVLLTGVGIIPLGIKFFSNLIEASSHHQPFLLSHALFFGKTKSESLCEDVEEATYRITSPTIC